MVKYSGEGLSKELWYFHWWFERNCQGRSPGRIRKKRRADEDEDESRQSRVVELSLRKA